MDRAGAIDRAVRQTAKAWAVAVQPNMLLRRWADNLASDDLEGIGLYVVPVIRENYQRSLR